MSQPSRRQTLAPHHEPLRVDVGFLGNLLGEVLRDQGGLELYEAVEEARLACISRREKGESPKTLLGDFSDLSVDQATLLVRAFATYFSLTNLAEQVHRTRRRRDYQFEERAQPGSLEAVFSSFKHIDPTRLRDAIDQLSITPVFTAHPTEAIRRTILKKEQRIARALVDRIEMPQRTPVEDHRLTEQIRAEVGLIWQTAGQASTRPTVADEVEHILFFLTEVIYRVVPPFREKLEKVAAYYLGSGVVSEKPLVPVRFGSWVGGDMDGNPNVGADTVLATLRRQRSLILQKYRTEVRTLFEHLSQSDARVGISETILEKTAEYKKQFPSTLGDIPARYHEMPYRSLLWMVWHRLGLTETQEAGGYAAPEALIDDLEIIDQSLTENQGARAGRHLVRRLLTRVRTFGFHLAMLDLRQDAELHRTVLAEYLGDKEYVSRDAKDRTRLLEEALEKPLKTQASPSEDLSKTLDVFRSIGEARATFGRQAVGPFIISMAQGPDDVLAVLVLARAAGLTDEEGRVPLDVAPLLETVDDLQAGESTLSSMLSHPLYREHLKARGNRQTVMLGYSDSAKISGVGASRWALYTAQERLLSVSEERGVALELFHGRGGTIARGGSKPRDAILAGPLGSTRGRLRATEQGEIINGKFGLRGIAERTLELTAGAVLEATVREPDESPVPEEWRRAMDTFASSSRSAWNNLVHEDARFIPYFRSATPIDIIERLAIGSRPASRRSGGGVENLRAIPWVFSWTQNRHTLPGWYGLGAGLEAIEAAHGLEMLKEMAEAWPFFSNLLADASMAMGKADMEIGSVYASLAPEEVRPLYGEILSVFEATQDRILRIREEQALLDREPLLQAIIKLRNPYVDPMSMIQVDLLRRWRATDRTDQALEGALFDTVRGIARGLRNTG